MGSSTKQEKPSNIKHNFSNTYNRTFPDIKRAVRAVNKH